MGRGKKVALYGRDLFGDEIKPVLASLATRFVVAPFSVLNAREGFWQRRKRQWLSLGIRGAAGRFNALDMGETNANPDFYVQKRKLEAEIGRELTTDEAREILAENGTIGLTPDRGANRRKKAKNTFNITNRPYNGSGDSDAETNCIRRKKKLTIRMTPGAYQEGASPEAKDLRIASKRSGGMVGGGPNSIIKRGRAGAFSLGFKEGNFDKRGRNLAKNQTPTEASGTSIFDPVLCELMYRWFAPPKGRILDPFSGGCTSGIVASVLGYRFTGIETRPEQVAANVPQAEKLGLNPEWILGDSEKLDSLIPENRQFDFIFTDPPYFDLEIYGGDANDGSMKQTFPQFLAWYRRIFKRCVNRLRESRFVAIKIGEVRSKTGEYRNLVGETVKCFLDLGLHYYNEIILVTAAGSLPIRAGKQFQTSRKIGKTHQNVLVFYKGDPAKIKEHFGHLEINPE